MKLTTIMLLVWAGMLWLAGCGPQQGGQSETQGSQAAASPTSQGTATKWRLGNTNEASLLTVSSSSELVEAHFKGKYLYPPAHVLDGDFATTWAEAVKGPGLGESLSFQFAEPISFDEIQIVNGLARTKQLYEANGRVHKLIVTELYGKLFQKRECELQDGVVGWQSIKFDKAQTASSINFTIKAVYQGKKYEDTCISDIRFLYKGKVLKYKDARRLIAFQEKQAREKVANTKIDLRADFNKHYSGTNRMAWDAPRFQGVHSQIIFRFAQFQDAEKRGFYKLEVKNFPTEDGEYKLAGSAVILKSYVSYARINRVMYLQPAGPDGFYLNGEYFKRLKS